MLPPSPLSPLNFFLTQPPPHVFLKTEDLVKSAQPDSVFATILPHPNVFPHPTPSPLSPEEVLLLTSIDVSAFKSLACLFLRSPPFGTRFPFLIFFLLLSFFDFSALAVAFGSSDVNFPQMASSPPPNTGTLFFLSLPVFRSSLL